MLNKEQITELFEHLGTPRAGRELILKARIQAPVREVKSRGGNVITLLASRKISAVGGTVKLPITLLWFRAAAGPLSTSSSGSL